MIVTVRRRVRLINYKGAWGRILRAKSNLNGRKYIEFWWYKFRKHTGHFSQFSEPARTIWHDPSIELDLSCSYLFFWLHCGSYSVLNDCFCCSFLFMFWIKSSPILTRLGPGKALAQLKFKNKASGNFGLNHGLEKTCASVAGLGACMEVVGKQAAPG